jgi:hypothetical protein
MIYIVSFSFLDQESVNQFWCGLFEKSRLKQEIKIFKKKNGNSNLLKQATEKVKKINSFKIIKTCPKFLAKIENPRIFT